MAAVSHIGKLVRSIAQNIFCRRNYYDTCFLANLRLLNSFLVSFLLLECVLIMKITHRVEMFVVNEIFLLFQSCDTEQVIQGSAVAQWLSA